ncbi:uncharacterized protein PADG_01339 [Paracoccidioides brasiliensis Pb18]|uniref:Uncharacterized protein n=1 Tax=Paracoccidioides brasiliensis (strain Pb18) TaxID=502780 RepID=C1G323_PARBD|nr:uncharacterized protein PADG_01339 [Paracoccidioides brasiliensis Pb18]EEH45189.1 hypothetical protein PADG_01339 [Paracoccidioides brasiliensis Pb18]
MSFDPLPRSSLPSSTKSRSIISKFTNRLGNRSRNIAEFYIQLDEPYRTYFSGEAVKGCVILKVVKPIRITHLVLCLHGYVKVFKNTVAPGEGSEESGFLGPGRGRRKSEYLGNGFATLFEDEVVLCGDGRLVEGIYKFKFNLEFPPYRLPSSITFERGTISYMLTSHLTRPTTISPTISCDKRVTLLETIDIAPLPLPKLRIISLEPVLRRSKMRSKTKGASRERIMQNSASADPIPNGIEHRPPLSPVSSEQSNSSCMSNSTQSFQVISEPNSTNSQSIANDDSQSTNTSSLDKTIKAKTELLRPGGVPGDILPVKITIQHTKPIRSPNGIIITLYRQGRIDYHPSIPVGPAEKGKKPVYEDYYPKSLTGLGGLSFGATRSSSVFRKDLSQIFAPLIVDPVTMMATVKTSIRIPEDVFPTITHVPGGMISFRYYLEVVMDLRGKLAGQDRFIPRLNMMAGSTNYSYSSSGQVLTLSEKGRNQITSPWAGNILDTDQVRREKSVVACVFEVVIGTKDSGKKQNQTTEMNQAPDDHSTTPQIVQHNNVYEWDHQYQCPYTHLHNDHDYANENGYDNNEISGWQAHPPRGQYASYHTPQFLPPTLPEEEIDEKTRLRRAEEALLPSKPSQQEDTVEVDSSTTSSALAPSAPVFFEDSPHEHISNNHFNSHYIHGNFVASAPSVNSITPFYQTSTNIPPLPLSLLEGSNSTRTPVTAQDDKQELERQRLLAQASSPDPQHLSIDETMATASPGGEEVARLMPSAPMLTEDDLTQPLATSESLPRYQR